MASNRLLGVRAAAAAAALVLTALLSLAADACADEARLAPPPVVGLAGGAASRIPVAAGDVADRADPPSRLVRTDPWPSAQAGSLYTYLINRAGRRERFVAPDEESSRAPLVAPRLVAEGRSDLRLRTDDRLFSLGLGFRHAGWIEIRAVTVLNFSAIPLGRPVAPDALAGWAPHRAGGELSVRMTENFHFQGGGGIEVPSDGLLDRRYHWAGWLLVEVGF